MHKAKAVVIACIDFRFQEKMHQFLRNESYLGKSDEIIVAGAVRDLVCPVNENDGRYLWKQLSLSINLHDPDEIILIDHQDCGGYAQDGAIAGGLSLEEDLEKHSRWMREAKKKIQEQYKDKEIQMLYIPLDGDILKITD